METITSIRPAVKIWYDEDKCATQKRPWFGELQSKSADRFSFAVLGDRCGITTPGIFEKALELLAHLKLNSSFR